MPNSPSDYFKFPDVLGNKSDTYSLFKKLREDFNGDLFTWYKEESEWITEKDLGTLQNFIAGRSMGAQQDLFFWAYKFDIIPVELISNIYEEFYHENSGGTDDKGTHYTPMPLVEFILSECLTKRRLDNGARILDPACGSGIFLVEAFREWFYMSARSEKLPQRSSLGRNLLGFWKE